MSRPINKKWFGLPAGAGLQIQVGGVRWADGTTETSAYIIKQKGSRSYLVQDIAKTRTPERAFLVNATAVGGLAPGQMFVLATPFGGSARPVVKIAQHRLSVYESNGTVGNYSWSATPADAAGEATLSLA